MVHNGAMAAPETSTPTEPSLKVDLHRHLEGAIRPSTAVELGHQLGIYPAGFTVADFEERAVIRTPVPLLEALERFDLFRAPIRGYRAVVRIAREAVEDAAAGGVTHLNLRFSPTTLAKASGLGMADTFRAVAEGIERARAPRPAVEPMVVISRRRGVEAAWRVVGALEQGSAELVVAADFAADEIRHRSAEFAAVAEALVGLGLPLTVHTGEGVPSDAVAEALALPGVRRLGHAISLVDDPELVRLAVERQLVVEVCPTSNFRAGTIASLTAHPAPRLLAGGVRIAICSDDPTLFGIELDHELRVARIELGLTAHQIRQAQRWARSAFFGATK